MASSTEVKPPMNEEEGSENAYSVEDNEDSETDRFSKVKPNLIRTPSVLNAIIDQIHPDIIAKSHQSNFVLFPPKLEGCTVVDLGCGIGRDVFILSKLVGENGRVIGVDSEKNQLDFARLHIDYHLNKFGINKSNIEFLEGEIDQLDQMNLQENSVDVVVSNSVVNYRRNKKAITEGVCKILKTGGEFYFSDVYVNRPIPVEHQELLAGEYVGGALRWEDLILYATEAGFTQPRLVTAKPVVLTNEDIESAIGKQDSTDFNTPYQLTYETPLATSEDEFFFDHLIQFKLGELLVVNDPSVALALSLSRYRENFIFDPIAGTDGESMTMTETVEELPSSQTGEVHRKTTTITTMTSTD